MKNVVKFLSSSVYILLGAALIIWPIAVGDVFTTVIAVAAAALGLGKTIGYFCTNVEYRIEEDTNSLAEGLTLLVLAAFVALKGMLFQMIIPFALGLMIVYKGIEGIQNAVNFNKLGKQVPKWIIIASLIITAFGILVMINPFSTAKLLYVMLGIGLFISGLTDFLSDIFFTAKMKKMKKELETEASENE